MVDSSIKDSSDSLFLFKMDSRVMVDQLHFNVFVANLAFNLNQKIKYVSIDIK
jgi:hypothetical protein